MDGPAFLRSVGNSPAAVTVLVRHLAKGTRHVGGLPQPWRTPAYAAAVAALQRGELTEAERLAASAGPAGAVLRGLVAGEIGLVTPSPRRAPASAPDRGDAVLHLVTNALPETVAGYTVRTQGIARAQRARGLDVHVATRIGFPVTRGHLSAAARVTVDGVEHHRALPARLPLRADDALARDIELTARLVSSLRPVVLHPVDGHPGSRAEVSLGDGEPDAGGDVHVEPAGALGAGDALGPDCVARDRVRQCVRHQVQHRVPAQGGEVAGWAGRGRRDQPDLSGHHPSEHRTDRAGRCCEPLGLGQLTALERGDRGGVRGRAPRLRQPTDVPRALGQVPDQDGDRGGGVPHGAEERWSVHGVSSRFGRPMNA